MAHELTTTPSPDILIASGQTLGAHAARHVATGSDPLTISVGWGSIIGPVSGNTNLVAEFATKLTTPAGLTAATGTVNPILTFQAQSLSQEPIKFLNTATQTIGGINTTSGDQIQFLAIDKDNQSVMAGLSAEFGHLLGGFEASGHPASAASGMAFLFYDDNKEAFFVDEDGLERNAMGQGVPGQTITGTSKTLARSDAGQYLRFTATAAITVTVNTAVFDAWQEVHMRQVGVGTLSLAGTASKSGSFTFASGKTATIKFYSASQYDIIPGG